jgi:Phenazine biosynthesis-like protein
VARLFVQVDVFASEPYAGNPVAVVLDGAGLSRDAMQRFARWTNLSDTTFVLAPESQDADYRVRIFTPGRELPFAGHPTLGSCHAWLEAGGARRREDVIVQECGAGLVPVRRLDAGLAFAAPPLVRSGRVDDELVGRLARMLGVERAAMTDTRWVDNGPGWVGVLLDDPQAALALTPRLDELDVGVSRRTRPARPRRSRSARSPTSTGAWTRTRSRAASTPRWPRGCSPPAGRPRPTWPARARRSAAPAASTSARTSTAPSGSAAAPSRAYAASSTSKARRDFCSPCDPTPASACGAVAREDLGCMKDAGFGDADGNTWALQEIPVGTGEDPRPAT